MLTKAVDSYIAMRRACGFAFQSEGTCLRSFAAFSDAKGHYQVGPPARCRYSIRSVRAGGRSVP
jgi:hypothetical protein